MKDIITLVFSKDRPLQLHATLQSLTNHCKDLNISNVVVIYKSSDEKVKKLYETVKKEFPKVKLIEQTNDFKRDMLHEIHPYKWICFLVDDNIFVRNFSLGKCINYLEDSDCSIGFSLRLGLNTTQCYTINTTQKIPEYISMDYSTMVFRWTDAEADFNYPAEISSSIFKISDIYPILEQCPYTNPNELESFMALNRAMFASKKYFLLSFKKSVTFCAPVNVVQTIYPNRKGNNPEYSATKLLDIFEKGGRINVEKFNNFVPMGCHQEVDFEFIYKEKQ